MRTVILMVFILSVNISCGRNNHGSSVNDVNSSAALDSVGVTGIDFRATRYDFGTVVHGEKLAYTFIYKNTGNVPLVIHSANADCGCTVPEFSTIPVEPGKEGSIKAVFDTRGFTGYQTKSIRVITNAGMQTLVLRAVVE